MDTSDRNFILTEHEKALIPKIEDISFYRNHGYYVSGFVLSDQEIETLREATHDYYDGQRDRTLPFVPKGTTYWRPGDNTDLRQNTYITYESQRMREILLKPIIGAIAAKLAETPEIRLFIDVLRYKASGDARETTVGWHVDRHFWQMFTSDAMLTAFIPLHDCSEEHGTIIMIDGSNRWREVGHPDDTTALHFAQRDPADLERRLDLEAEANGTVARRVPINLKAGQISFHNSLTYHGSLHNVSDRPRQTVSLHFQDRDNSYRRHKLDSGALASHHTSQLCAKLPNGDPDYRDPEYFPVLWRE